MQQSPVLMENAHIMLEMAAKCSNYAKNSGLCFFFWIMLFEADYAKNYASILYQCLLSLTLSLYIYISLFFFFLLLFCHSRPLLCAVGILKVDSCLLNLSYNKQTFLN